MNRTLLVLITVVALACPAAISHAQQPAEKNRKLSEDKAKDLATLINIIETTNDAAKAIKAYARGSTIDRNNVWLHEAQMRKMLTLGQPLAASYPAKILNGLDPKNALAWGVTGYAEGRKGNYDDAMQAAMKSLELDITNASVLHNAGQLVAWYESQLKPAKLNDRQKRIMDKLKDNIEELEEFSKSYAKIRDALDEQAKLIEEFNKLIAEAEKVADKYRSDLKRLGASVSQINDDIADHQENIRSLRREYLIYTYVETDDDDDDTTNRRRNSYNRAMRRKILDEIEDEEDDIDELKRERNVIMREANSVKKNLKESEGKVDEIRKKSLAAAKRFRSRFRWDPPAVDGVMTPDRENIPRSTANLPPLSKNPEAEANTRLQLAVAYLQNDMPEKAADILREIITKYKDTKAAKEAKKLLESIPKDKPEDKSDA